MVVVEWDWGSDFQPWLQPAALALDRAVKLCQSPPAIDSQTILLKVSVHSKIRQDVSPRSGDPERTDSPGDLTGLVQFAVPHYITPQSLANAGRSTLISANDMMTNKSSLIRRPTLLDLPGFRLVAAYPVVPVRGDPMLRTKCGKFLWNIRLLAPILIFLIMFHIATSVLTPGARDISVHDSSGNFRFQYTKEHYGVYIVKTCVIWISIFLFLYAVSFGLARFTCKMVDCYLFIGSWLVLRFAVMHEHLFCEREAGEIDLLWIVSAWFCEVAVFLPGIVCLVIIDASVFSRAWKLVWMTCFFSFRVFVYVKARFFYTWVSNDICFTKHCVSAGELYSMASFSFLVFILRAALMYAFGEEFAFLYTTYTECRTVEEAQQLFTVIASEQNVEQMVGRATRLTKSGRMLQEFSRSNSHVAVSRTHSLTSRSGARSRKPSTTSKGTAHSKNTLVRIREISTQQLNDEQMVDSAALSKFDDSRSVATPKFNADWQPLNGDGTRSNKTVTFNVDRADGSSASQFSGDQMVTISSIQITDIDDLSYEAATAMDESHPAVQWRTSASGCDLDELVITMAGDIDE